MGLRDILGPSKKDLLAAIENTQKENEDLRASIQRTEGKQRLLEEQVKTRSKVLNRTLFYSTNKVDSTGRSRDGNIYYGPHYDLSELGRAIDVEPYISISVRKHREQILKEGHQIVGPEDEMNDYIRRRLFEMFLVSGVTTEEWLRQFTTNLIHYGTAFLVIKRDVQRSSGVRIKMYGKKMDPIAAVFPRS